MNILHIIPGDLWAGAEAQVFYTVKALHEDSQSKIGVILFYKGELYKRLLVEGIDVVLLDESYLSNIEICKRIMQELNNRNVQIVHVHEYKSHILAALACICTKGKCIIFRTKHGQNVPSRFKSHIVLNIEKIFLRYMTDYLIAVSEELKDILSNKKTKASIHHIYNSIDLGVVTQALTKSVFDVRISYGISEEKFWIGTAARLEDVKNISMLVKAARILKSVHGITNFRVSIYGEGRLRDIINRQIMQYGLKEHVFLEGHNDNILPVLKALDVFTLTSNHEGLPMSLLEAMSVGTIPICTSVGGMKEVITHGEDGFLINSGDANELASVLSYIYRSEDRLGIVGKKARQKIRDTFSVDQGRRALMNLYVKSLHMKYKQCKK